MCDKCDKAWPNISRSSSYLSLSLLFLPACYVVLYHFTSEISSFMGANLSKALGVFLASNSIFLTSWAILSSGLGKIFGNKEMRLLMLGLDAAGKTSKPPPMSCILTGLIPGSAILYKLKLNQSVTTIPTGASAALSVLFPV